MGSVGSSSPSSSGADKNDDTKTSTSSSSKSGTSQTSTTSQKSESNQTGATGTNASFDDVMAEAAGARAAGPPGIATPPSTPSTSSGNTSFGDTTPNYTGPVNDPRGPALSGGDENDPTRAAGPPGTATAPPTTGITDPGLTPEQSEALAQSAAVMSGVATVPSHTSAALTVDPITAERGLDLLGRPPSFDDANQIQVADAGTNSGFLNDIGQAIKDDYEGSMVEGAVTAIRDDFNRSIIGNALTDRENLSLEIKAESIIGGATMTLSDKDNDGKVEFNTEASAKSEFGSFNFDPDDEFNFTVDSPNTVSQFNNDGSGSFTAKGKNLSGSITGDGDITIDANGKVPVNPLTRVTGGITRTMPSNGGPITVDTRAGVEVGVPGVATLSAEVKARDIFDANDPETPDQPVETTAPVTGPVDQIAEIEQPDIARHIAEKKEREREQAEAEAGASGSSRSQDSLGIETKEQRFLGF